jgi:N-acetylmuramoyl-L-alanine amidase
MVDPKNHPDSADNKLVTLVIDPGQGGSNTGVQAFYIVEKNKTLQLATIAKYQLTQADPRLRVYLTRDNDWNPTFKMRANMAKKLPADLVISLHLNGSSDPDAAGLWYFYKHGCLISKRLCENAAKTPPPYFRRSKVRVFDAYDTPEIEGDEWLARPEHVIEQYPMPALLIEYGFATNPIDAGYLLGKSPGKDLADVIAGIVWDFRRIP